MSRASVVSPTGSEASSTSRFSTLLPAGSISNTTGTSTSTTLPSLPSKRTAIPHTATIYDRSLTKGKGSEVSLSAYSFLFAEIVRYTHSRVDGIGDFEKNHSYDYPPTARLNILGYHVGVRLLSLTLLRDTIAASAASSTFRSSMVATNPQRMTRLLPSLSWIHTTLWRIVVGKVADALERSNENSDEYMISDNDLLLTRHVAVPKEMSQLSCGAMMAGIVEACLDGLGFPSRVTSHSVPSEAFPKRTTILIKLEPDVMEREAAMDAAKV